MSTATESALYVEVRNRLLDMVDALGTMTQAFGATPRIYQDSPPETAAFPYIILRVLDNGGSAGQENPYRHAKMIEAMVLGRPKSALTAVRRIGDLVEGAFLTWHTQPDGVIHVTGYSRDPVAGGTSDADASVVQERHTAPFLMYRPLPAPIGTPVLTTIVLTPSSDTLEEGETQQFTAAGFDQFGDPFTLVAPVWSVLAGTGTGSITQGGLFTALTDGTVTVRATKSGVTGSAPVTITPVPRVLTTITVAPATATLDEEATQQFVASGFDQFGDPFALVGDGVWSVENAGQGSVDANGLFTADAPGTTEVRYTEDGVQGAADVTVEAVGEDFDLLATFTGPNGTNVHGLTPDIGIGPGVVHTGSMEILNNEAKPTSGNTWFSFPVSSPNGRTEVDILGGFSSGIGLTIGVTDQNSNIVLLNNGTATGFEVYRVSGGGFNLIAFGAADWTPPIRLGCVRNGNVLDYDIDTVPIVVGLVESHGAAVGRVGGVSSSNPLDQLTHVVTP